jgi:hypothetical protein
VITGLAFAGLIIWACVWGWRRFMPEPYPTFCRHARMTVMDGETNTCQHCGELIR